MLDVCWYFLHFVGAFFRCGKRKCWESHTGLGGLGSHTIWPPCATTAGLTIGSSHRSPPKSLAPPNTWNWCMWWMWVQKNHLYHPVPSLSQGKFASSSIQNFFVDSHDPQKISRNLRFLTENIWRKVNSQAVPETGTFSALTHSITFPSTLTALINQPPAKLRSCFQAFHWTGRPSEMHSSSPQFTMEISVIQLHQPPMGAKPTRSLPIPSLKKMKNTGFSLLIIFILFMSNSPT